MARKKYNFNKRKLDTQRYIALDNLLQEYRDIEYKLNLRRAQLKMKHEVDENTGGGRSSTISKPVEEESVRYLSDTVVINLENTKKIVEKLLADLDELDKEIFYYLWLDRSDLTCSEISEKVHLSKSSLYRHKDFILEEFDKLRGGL